MSKHAEQVVSHIANAQTAYEVSTAVNAITHMHGSMATATHNIMASRVVSPNGTSVQEYSDDDGEYGLARVILKVLQRYNITNKVVIVTRWASGIQLGLKRYDIIRKCTETIVEQEGLLHDQRQTNGPSAAPQVSVQKMASPSTNPNVQKMASPSTNPNDRGQPSGAHCWKTVPQDNHGTILMEKFLS